MSATVPPRPSQQKPPFYRDVRVLRWVGQIIVVVTVIGFFVWLYNNAITNLQQANLPTGFDFLDRRAGFAIPGLSDSANYTITQSFLAGYLNTVRVIMVGVPAATILGILIGIARLSQNAAARAFGTTYVETFRNVPVLIWIFFITNVALVENLPQIQEEVTPLGITVVSNRGIGVPWINTEANGTLFIGVILLGAIAAALVVRWRGAVNAKTGDPARGGLFGTGAFLLFVVIAHVVSGGALALDVPTVNGRLIVGGMQMPVPYAGLTLGLVLYTASHIAEIVRGGIQAVAKGQSEAANAIALTTFQRYRWVVLPQAFRIMIPPLASQYLNLTKNSSLAVAVSFVEITAIFQRVSNNATPALQGVVILMALYLSFSLSISLVMNVINRRLSLESR